MSDRITSQDGKYEGVLDVTDGNFVVRRVADGKQISTLGPKPTPSASVSPSASASPSEKPVPDDEHEHMFSPTPLPLPPETNNRKSIIAIILLIGIPWVLYLVFL